MGYDVSVLYKRRVSSKQHPDGKVKQYSNQSGLDFNIKDYQYHIDNLIGKFNLKLGVSFKEVIPFKKWFRKTDDAAGLKYHAHNLDDVLIFEEQLMEQCLADSILVEKIKY